MPIGDLAGHQRARRMLGDVPVVMISDGEGIYVLADRCSHLPGPLAFSTRVNDGTLQVCLPGAG